MLYDDMFVFRKELPAYLPANQVPPQAKRKRSLPLVRSIISKWVLVLPLMVQCFIQDILETPSPILYKRPRRRIEEEEDVDIPSQPSKPLDGDSAPGGSSMDSVESAVSVSVRGGEECTSTHLSLDGSKVCVPVVKFC